MQFSVIGMHRSGTSLTAKILNIAGTYLGDDSALMPADVSNAKGYWENVTFLDFNEKLLQHFGGAWDAPPALPPDWATDDTIAGLRNEARAYIAAEFDSKPIWAWKEPRTTVLLPFWQTIVPDLQYVICVRNPLDVAASLATRDQFTFKNAIGLWQLYTLRALMDTPVENSTIVLYEDLVESPRTAAERLLADLGLTRHMDDGKWAEIDSFVDPNLEHHHHSLDDLLTHPEVPTSAKELYSVLVTGRESAFDRARVEAGMAIDWLYNYLAQCAETRSLASQTERLRSYSNSLQSQLEDTRRAMEHFKAILETRPHRLATRAGEIAKNLRPKRSGSAEM